MTSEPLNGVVLRMQEINARQLHSSLALPRVEPTREMLHLWGRLEEHAARRGVRSFPCTPALCAEWLSTLEDSALEEACAAIQTIHDSVGASSPVCSLAVRTVLERRLRPETPRSWSKEDRAFFASLPVEIRAILTRRENERDASLRTRQNKLAAAIKSASADGAEPKKEVIENEQK